MLNALSLVTAVLCPAALIAIAGGGWWLGRRSRGARPRVAGRALRGDASGAATAGQTFLFADLVGFTALTEAHGDRHAAQVARDFDQAVRGMAAEHRAEPVKSLGDGVMIRAEDAREAIELALRVVCDAGGRHGRPLARVGVHTGPAVEDGGDWYGATVNVAARIAGAAAPGEVLVSEQTRAAAGHLEGVELQELAPRRLRNVARPVPMFRAQRAGRDERYALVTDPVCRMAVSLDRRAGSQVVGGTEYSFCSSPCAERFAENPEAFLAQRRDGRSVMRPALTASV